MAEPRKVFRIEQTAAVRLEESAQTVQAGLRHGEIMRELAALRGALAVAAPPRPDAIMAPDPAPDRRSEMAHLTGELNLIAGAIKGDDDAGKSDGPNGARKAPSRLEHELKAVVNGTEQATQKILAAAEAIDSAATALSASLSGRIECDLAQDIQDLVIQIFEACNFQDLIGQRVGKISATLAFIEHHVGRVVDEIKIAAVAVRDDGHALHGPRLDSDPGHASQGDIDAMFANERG